jgi:hypothetical protein
MSKPLVRLAFKLASPKKKRVSKGKILTKKVCCVCMMSEDGEFKANLRIIGDRQKVTNLLVPFTLNSYSCKNKERVFTKKKDNYGKRICHIRTVEQAKLAPHKSNLYTPFCENWVYEGYLVKIKEQLYFEIKRAIWHKDFCKEDLDINKEDIKI